MGMGFIELTDFLQNDRENLLPSIFDHKETTVVTMKLNFAKEWEWPRPKDPNESK
jgi:hypothetical protein